MKKWLAIFLLALLLFNTTGYYFFFIVNEFSAKAEAWFEVHEKDNDANLVYLKLPVVDGRIIAGRLSFINSSEFIYNDKMYDLAARTDSDGIAVLKCYCDVNESKTIAGFSRQMETRQGQPANDQKPTPLKDLVKYYVFQAYSIVIVVPLAFTNCYNIQNSLAVFSPAHSVITPPPDLF